MTNNFDLDLNTILQDYLSASGQDNNLILSNFIELESKYSAEEIELIYSYFLQNAQNPETEPEVVVEDDNK